MVSQDRISTREEVAGFEDPTEHVNYPKSTISLEDRYVDEPRRLRVVVIGAGLAGILAGILLPAKIPEIDLTIFEKNFDVVGLTEPNS